MWLSWEMRASKKWDYFQLFAVQNTCVFMVGDLAADSSPATSNYPTSEHFGLNYKNAQWQWGLQLSANRAKIVGHVLDVFDLKRACVR